MIKYLRIFSLLVVLNNLSLVKPDSQWKKDANAIGFRGYDIKSFYISYFGDKYEPNQDFTGMVFYDLGSCTRSVAGICGKMRPGYIVIYKDDELTEKRDDNSLNSLGHTGLKTDILENPKSSKMGQKWPFLGCFLIFCRN